MKICWKYIQFIDKFSKLIAIIIDWKTVEKLKNSKFSKNNKYCATFFEFTNFDDFVISVFNYCNIFNNVKQFVFHDFFKNITTQFVAFIFNEIFALNVFLKTCKQKAIFYFLMLFEIVFEPTYFEYFLTKNVNIAKNLSKFV